jgi:hypothetical protein
MQRGKTTTTLKPGARARQTLRDPQQRLTNLSTVKFIEVKYIKIALCKSQLHKALPEQHNLQMPTSIASTYYSKLQIKLQTYTLQQ